MATHPSNGQTSSSRERLLQAAKQLFAAQGYEQTATSAIARAAGTSESQLMRYFGGKVGLLDTLFEQAWIDLNGEVKRVAAGETSGREAILEVLQSIATGLARDPDLAVLLLFEGRRLRGDEPRVRLSRGFVSFSELVRTFVKRAQAAREIDPALDTGALTAALLGSAEALIRDRVLARVGGGRSYAEREIRRTLEALLVGLAPGSIRGRRAARGVAPRSTRRNK